MDSQARARTLVAWAVGTERGLGTRNRTRTLEPQSESDAEMHLTSPKEFLSNLAIGCLVLPIVGFVFGGCGCLYCYMLATN